MTRPREAGMILVNVLVALALGAALVTLMMTSQEEAIDRARRAGAAAQAEALALGAETSVAVALRRDLEESPETDSYGEDWAQAAQAEVELATGRFAVTLRDAQAGLDLNGLSGGGLAQTQDLARLVAVLELPPETADRIAAAERERGPLLRLDQIEELDAETAARLAPFVSFLPRPRPVNLNTADPLLMRALLGNSAVARRLAAQREQNGTLARQNLLDLGLIPTGNVGFQSDIWDVTVLATVDGVAVTLNSRLVRDRGPGTAEVVVASRRWGDRPAGPLPSLPGLP
jgi:general secretion pathway protein K